MHSFKTPLISLLLLLCCASVSIADVVIDNLSQPIDGTRVAPQVGASFINGSAISLQDVIISQTVRTPNPNQFLTLNARNADGTIGASQLTFLPGVFSAGLTTFTPTAPFLLAANTGYWLVLNGFSSWDVTSSITSTSMNGSTMPATSAAFSQGYTNLSQGPQVYRVDGTTTTTVPDTGSTLLLLGLSLFGLCGLRHTRCAW